MEQKVLQLSSRLMAISTFQEDQPTVKYDIYIYICNAVVAKITIIQFHDC